MAMKPAVLALSFMGEVSLSLVGLVRRIVARASNPIVDAAGNG
jgi:hypothetical protein